VGNRFRPHIGTEYEAGLIGGRKLLLIGESHYNGPDYEPCGPEATCDAIKSYLGGTSIPFFDYVHKASCGHLHNVTREDFWKRVAFANFIQRPMDTASHRPTDDDWREGTEVFWDTLSKLKPDLVFMFTSAWSNCLPDLAPGGVAVRTGPVGEGDTWLWRYGFSDHDVLIARFYHRSARPNPSIAVWKAWADHCWQAGDALHG